MQVSTIGVHESVESVFPPAELRDELADLDQTVRVVGDDDLDACDAVVTFEHREAFLRSVDWVHSIQAGYDRFPVAAFEAAGVVLTNSTGIHGTSVGETVLGMLLALARRLHSYARNQTEREWAWPAWDEPFTLADERLCVVGLGTLGRGIAERAAAVGMTVDGVRRTPDPVPHVDEVYAADDLHEAVADARFVALATPLTEATRGLMDRAAFDAMRDDAYFVNVARGACADQEALVDALQARSLAGAALDVFETEPLPESSPLWGMDDVVVTPHAAAAERDYHRHVADLVRENVRNAADEEFVNRVA